MQIDAIPMLDKAADESLVADLVQIGQFSKNLWVRIFGPALFKLADHGLREPF